MSSTSQQILEAQRLAESIEKGETKQETPASASGASAEQLTTVTQKAGKDIPEDATTEGGMKPESAKVVDRKESAQPVVAREIAQVVGQGQEHKLKEFFTDPTVAAEEKTSVEKTNQTPAEKQTQLSDSQIDNEDHHSKVKAGSLDAQDETPAAKQTKVEEKQKVTKDKKEPKVEEKKEKSKVEEKKVEEKKPKEEKTKVVEKKDV